jgi:hypothetical protein
VHRWRWLRVRVRVGIALPQDDGGSQRRRQRAVGDGLLVGVFDTLVRMSVPVRVLVFVVPVLVFVHSGHRVRLRALAKALPQHPDANPQDQESRHDFHHFVNRVGYEVRSGDGREYPQNDDAEGVGEGDDTTERYRISHSTLRSHQVGGHDGLAVAWLERVQRSKHESRKDEYEIVHSILTGARLLYQSTSATLHAVDRASG